MSEILIWVCYTCVPLFFLLGMGKSFKKCSGGLGPFLSESQLTGLFDQCIGWINCFLSSVVLGTHPQGHTRSAQWLPGPFLVMLSMPCGVVIKWKLVHMRYVLQTLYFLTGLITFNFLGNKIFVFGDMDVFQMFSLCTSVNKVLNYPQSHIVCIE